MTRESYQGIRNRKSTMHIGRHLCILSWNALHIVLDLKTSIFDKFHEN